MALLEVNTVRQVTATVTIGETTAELTDKYAAFIHAPADDVVDKALNFVFSKDREFQEFLKSSAAQNAPGSLRVRKGPQNNKSESKSNEAKGDASPGPSLLPSA